MNIPAPPKWWWTYNSLLTCGRGQIFDMGRLTIPWGSCSDHSCCHLRLGGHHWWILWSSGMEPCCPPSGSQDLQVGCCWMSDASVGDVAAHGDSQQTTLPVVLELLLLSPGQSTHFDVWVVNGGQLGGWFANQKMSRGKIGVVWIIWKNTTGGRMCYHDDLLIWCTSMHHMLAHCCRRIHVIEY